MPDRFLIVATCCCGLSPIFRRLEDEDVRGDRAEGMLTYQPEGGLEITKQDGSVHKLKGMKFTSTAQLDEIFVFCASTACSQELARRFESPFCVEIDDPDRLIGRLRARAHAKSSLDYDKVVAGKVDYRESRREPAADWALPDKLAFMKPPPFSWQHEFRIALPRRVAFDPHAVDCRLTDGTANPIADLIAAHLLLKVRRIADFAKLHRL